MQEVNWITVILGGTVGALLGALITQLGQLYFTNRKEEADRLKEVNNHNAAYHLKRKEHLGTLIATLLELSLLAQSHKMNTMTGVVPQDELKAIREKYDKLKSICVVEAELYGSIPFDIPNLRTRELSQYVYTIIVAKLGGYAFSHRNNTEHFDNIEHQVPFTDDLRTLVQVEDTLAKDSLLLPAKRTYSPPRVPYMELQAKYIDKRKIDLTQINMDYLEFLLPENRLTFKLSEAKDKAKDK